METFILVLFDRNVSILSPARAVPWRFLRELGQGFFLMIGSGSEGQDPWPCVWLVSSHLKVAPCVLSDCKLLCLYVRGISETPSITTGEVVRVEGHVS